MGLTFKQQQDKLSRMVGDSNTSSDDAWPLVDRQLEINRGELLFAKRTKSLLRRIDGTVASNKIPLPADFGGIHIVQANDIVMTSENEMALSDYDRYVNSGDDRYYFWVDASGSTTRALNFIAPNTNGQPYIMWYWGIPSANLSEDDDESPLQDEYREGPVFYAASQLLPQTGKLQLAQHYENKYLAMAIEAQEETEKKVLTVVKAFPDVFPLHEFDKDIQGIGAFPGGLPV